ncbi:glycoside hydrolase superfamily [Aspergillus avenaceus]|uniref:Glycoside hydrolase superfamily n=1 Tax=Aspergillus avenaceus TaxID=36643 RepID=A0A5N6TJU8_ASPAV|nr:glycoside hydrolase superfamily [Aspergillus avenaceus]
MQPLRLLALTAILQGSSVLGAECSGSFDAITAKDFTAKLDPGWNLGNTLDATPDEGSWNNAPVEESTLDYAKSAGFKSVRLPVTWTHHFTSESPDWTVDSEWLQRVSDVVDMITSRDLYTLVNVHHDSWEWADVTQSDANQTMIEEKFYRLWYQIGTKLACTSSLVAFESINEPPCETAEDGAKVNRFNEIFLKAINDAGGFNPQRVVNLVGGGSDSEKTSQWFELPANITNPYAIQFHFYSPYDFIFSAWGETIWGSDADKAEIETTLDLIRGNFTDVPLVLGEYDASPTNTEPAARWKYHEHLVRTAAKYDISTILWDNGLDHLDRTSGTWRDPTSISIITTSESNSLPDSTEDASATSQWSSAYIFLKVGDEVTDQKLPYLFNGNTLTSISDEKGTALAADAYAVSSDAITFSSTYLSTLDTTNPGILATLTLEFSAGASPTLQIVQWDTPSLSSTSAAASSVSGSDLSIPITWKGLSKPAAVKALTSSGTYLFDDWTQYLGPLQQARATYNNQWNWDEENVILTSAAIDAVVAAGEDTVFTFEFYPRVDESNAVNFTLTV